MDRCFFFLLLMGISFAVPVCPSFSYRDYVAATSYSSPVAPEDTLLHYCDLNLSTICILSNAFNTTQDKKLFIAESIANDSFENIWNWNSNLSFGKYPPNNSISSTNIKDAWVSIAYLNPSVYDNGTYLINASTQPLIKSNFTFVVDTRRLAGDCNDNFRICGYDYSIPVANTSSSITATLNVRSQYLVDRYHWVTHCDMSGCWVTCDYYRTENHPDSLSVTDSKHIQLVNFTSDSNYSVVDYYNGLAEINVTANDSNVFFQMGNSSFYKTNYLYRIRNESGPYNILVKEVIPTNQTSIYGLSILDQNNSTFRLLAPYSSNCSLTVSSYFTSSTSSGCDISNLTNTSTIPEIHPVTPSFFSNFWNAVLLLIVVYLLYQIGKKVIYNA